MPQVLVCVKFCPERILHEAAQVRLPDRRALELGSRVVRRWLGAMDRLGVERGWRGALE